MTVTLDSHRFSRLADYVGRLPAGLASYPEARAKASIYRMVLDDHPLATPPAGLPEALRDLIVDPAAVSSWLPEVVGNALHLAIADAHGVDDSTFVGWASLANRKLFESRLYRFLMRAVSPATILKGARSRWSAFHDGTGFAVESEERQAVVRLTFPPHLHSPLMLGCFAVAFEAALASGRAREPTVTLSRTTATEAHYLGRWT